jgi:hypothetical protein
MQGTGSTGAKTGASSTGTNDTGMAGNTGASC